MMTKPLIPDHYWALVTMDQEGGLDMSFWETHDEAKKALFKLPIRLRQVGLR